MKLSELTSIIFQKILKSDISVKKHSSNGISLNGNVFVASSLSSNLSEFFATVPILEEITKLDPNAVLLISSNPASFLSGLRFEFDAHLDRLKSKSVDEVGDMALSLGWAEEDSRIKDLEFIQEQKSRGNIYVHCKPLGKTADLSRATFDGQLNNLPKEVRPIVLSKIKVACVTYHPCLPIGLFNVSRDMEVTYGLDTHTALNTYKTPGWKSEYGDPVLDPRIEKLFRFVFLGDGCVNHVFSWIHSLIYDNGKPMPIMVLHSIGGIGKGRVFEAVLGAMVGVGNFQKPSSNQENRFDSHMVSCHLFYASEAVLTESSASRYKDLYDGFAAAERKGIDLGKPKRIATRFVLSSNNASDLYMNYDARKFTIPDMQKESVLNDFMSTEELSFIEDFKTNYKAQADFAAWLRDYTEPLKFEEVWHGEDFKHLCEYHLPGWFKTFRTMLEKNKQFTHDELKDNLTGGTNKISAGKVSEVLREYQAATKSKICEILPSPDGLDTGVMYVSKIFKPEGGV